ncbi:uncharacterized protein L203_105682 [Cryptococcus depauperatus CBS 7841]|uniref:Carbohydrate kinase PfkB domain-containing protein n=1 Tax=Cryptococcus depauperatus CBS 7841 TaxID=1295531 RepID=A0AAJ8JXX7_9TREE
MMSLLRSQLGSPIISRQNHPRRCIHGLTQAKKLWGNRLVIAEEVEAALNSDAPVIALESTIITHGMPPPVNLSTARSIESIIRSFSVVPATIAIIRGKIHVGLSAQQLEEIADVESDLGRGAIKVSRRDLAPILAMKKTGGTTVAGTMYIGSSVGIKMFVTGGIGGVHRGAESSMDISADLIELGRTPMAVVCAGAKSILDIPKTLEVLETQGVCVATYSDKPEFPAFYHPSSGCQSPWSVADTTTAASLIYSSLTLPTPLSTLLAVPIPSKLAEAGAVVQNFVEQAVRESIEQGIDRRGKEVTPWLLKRVGELTQGVALDLNVNLIENNAHVGSQVAVELSKLYKNHSQTKSEHASVAPYPLPQISATDSPIAISIPTPVKTLFSSSTLVFGSAAIDLTSVSPQSLSPQTTTPGKVYLSPGGVGRNIAEAAQNLLPPHAVQLISVYGILNDPSPDNTIEPDAFGKVLMMEMAGAGMRVDGLVGKPNRNTAVCSLILGKDGDLVAGVADMDIVDTLTEKMVERKISEEKPQMVVFDLNPLEGSIKSILRTCQSLSISTFCDPTSTPKLPRLIPALISLLPSSPSSPRPLTHASPNLLELDLLHSILSSHVSDDSHVSDVVWRFINSLNLSNEWRRMVEAFTGKEEREWMRTEGVVQKMVSCLPFIQSFWVKAGNKGLLHLRVTRTKPQKLQNTIIHELEGQHEGKFLALTHYQPPIIKPEEIVSTTGAGDTLVGGLVAGLVGSQNEAEEVWVNRALDQVRTSLKSRRAVG